MARGREKDPCCFQVLDRAGRLHGRALHATAAIKQALQLYGLELTGRQLKRFQKYLNKKGKKQPSGARLSVPGLEVDGAVFVYVGRQSKQGEEVRSRARDESGRVCLILRVM